MGLYSVTISDVYPPQCVVVWENRDNAQQLADHLNKTIQNVVTVQQVDSFFPSHMTESDRVWRDAADNYLMGNHINRTGDSD